MHRTLGDFIRDRREVMGLNQTELWRLSGVPRETINRIENNKTMLPSADSRRRLATALHVRHVDLLVAAGELTEDEIDDVAPMVANDPDVDIIAESWPLCRPRSMWSGWSGRATRSPRCRATRSTTARC